MPFLSPYLQLKTDFITLLKETSGLDRHSRWSETKKKLDSDPRYKAVDSSSRREDWFRDYVKHLKEEKRSKSTDKGGDRDREKEKEKEKDKDEEVCEYY